MSVARDAPYERRWARGPRNPAPMRTRGRLRMNRAAWRAPLLNPDRSVGGAVDSAAHKWARLARAGAPPNTILPQAKWPPMAPSR
jgi:hypothetical protein